jgi:hypothetical protein
MLSRVVIASMGSYLRSLYATAGASMKNAGMRSPADVAPSRHQAEET